MRVHDEYRASEPVIRFLRHCYVFVSQTWQHAVRDTMPDKGFEKQFRTSCIETKTLSGWTISQVREMSLGSGLTTSSGVLHEIDLVAQCASTSAIAELKNRSSGPPDKNDVIVFWAKLLDYLTCNPDLLLKEICPVVLSSTTIDSHGLAACLGLGIHPISPQLRPLPILVHNAKCLEDELQKGLVIGHEVQERYDDFCAKVNSLSVTLRDTWFSSRCSRLSENKLFMQAVCGIDTLALVSDFRTINADCSILMDAFKKARKQVCV